MPLDLTHAILEIMGKPHSMIRHVADRPGHDRRHVVDASRLREELGWEPARSAWPEALADTVAWYRSNQCWWRTLESGTLDRRAA